MASTYSPNLRLELIGTGEQQGTWGTTTNTNLGTLLEEAIGGYVSVPVTDGADTVLTTANGGADQSRNMTINLSGALTGARNVICPAIEKLYVVKNSTTGGFAVTFKVFGQTGVTIANGQTAILFVDGTDARPATSAITSSGLVPVAAGGTGASTASSAATNLGLGTGDSPQFTAVNIGNATDTTITRSSAGVIAVEGGIVPLENRTNTFSANQIIEVTDNTNAALRVTQLGTGNAILVEDSTNPDSTPFVVNSSGSVGIGTTAPDALLSVNGIASFGAGAASTPSIAAFGDLNTGMWYPAADTIAWSTGGSERMRIRSDGDIGIGGIGSAYASLTIQKSITGGALAVGVDLGANVQSDVSNCFGYNTSLGTQATTFTTNIQHYRAAQGTFGAGSTVSAQYGFIANGGLIGATNNYGFHASDTAAITTGKTAYGFYSAINTATGGGTTWGFYAAGTAPNYFAGQVQLAAGSAGTPSLSAFGDTNTGMWYPAADTVAWATGGSERMRIDSSGNVGIGTSSPLGAAGYKWLTISGTNGGAVLSLAGNGGEQFRLQMVDGTATYLYTLTNTPIILAPNSTERVRITSGGNVGIGTSTFGTSAATVLGIATGTAPTTGPADTIQIYSTDLSAGNTMLSLYTEGTVVNANTTAAATHRIAIRVNGTVYYLLANTAA